MKKIALICSLSLMLGLLSGTANNNNDEILIAPDYIQSFYDYYSVNMINSRALGMGNTSVALRGGIEYALTNPASFKGKELNIYFEGNAKGETKEMNRYINKEDPDEAEERQTLEGGIPAITIGIGHPISSRMSLGASFSMPQTIKYNLFARFLPTGVYVDRFPAMRNYQGTLTYTGHFGNFNAGLNLILNHYTFEDLRIEKTYDRIVRMSENVFRFQPGFLYSNDVYSVGASYKFPADQKFNLQNDVRNAPLYHSYDVTLPGLLEAGASYNIAQDTKVALALEFEQTSMQFEEFDDRLTIKGGLEKRYDDYSLRAGLINVPGIYTGRHDTVKGDGDPREFVVNYDYLKVEETDQLIATGGFTYYLPNVDFSIAAAKDLLGNVDIFQISFSFDIKLGQIIRDTHEARRR